MLQRLSGTEFATQEGTLYPLLSKLRREGLVDYEWQESEVGPPRKYYRLTAKGRTHLGERRICLCRPAVLSGPRGGTAARQPRSRRDRRRPRTGDCRQVRPLSGRQQERCQQ